MKAVFLIIVGEAKGRLSQFAKSTNPTKFYTGSKTLRPVLTHMLSSSNLGLMKLNESCQGRGA